MHYTFYLLKNDLLPTIFVQFVLNEIKIYYTLFMFAYKTFLSKSVERRKFFFICFLTLDFKIINILSSCLIVTVYIYIFSFLHQFFHEDSLARHHFTAKGNFFISHQFCTGVTFARVSLLHKTLFLHG